MPEPDVTCKHCGSKIDEIYPDYCPECGMIAPERHAEMEKTVALVDVVITEFTLIARGKEPNQANWDDFWEHAPQENDVWWEKFGLHRFLILEDKYGMDLADKYLDEEMASLDTKQPKDL